MNGLAVFRTMQSQAFNVCAQALFHDEHSWRAVGMCSLAAKDRTCVRKETCGACVLIQVVSAVYVLLWASRNITAESDHAVSW